MAFPRKRWILGVALLVLAGAGATVYWRGRAVPVDVLQVRLAPLVRTVQFSARVQALSRVDIGATVTGRVAEVLVDEGAQVREGAELVRLEAQELRAALAQARLDGAPVTGWRATRYAWMQKLVLSNLRSFLGLQNIKTAMTGAAPVPPDLLRWYMAVGIDLLEAFGMTETCGFCTSMPPDRIRIGTAGVRAQGTEIRLGADNEVLVRGPNVFAGYWKLPAKTHEAIDAEGWLHTGDCGEIDADGYLAIRDRLKDIIITSGGKNITPSNIESHLKFSPYVSDAVVIGEGRNYLTCLVMLDQDNVAKFAQDHQVPYTDFASMTRAAEVVALIQAELERVNTKLARVEQIKDFRIIAQLLTAEDDELTPTMKLKRKVVASKYADVIETMYKS